ncbi:MAG: hypothetical protein BroJett003_12170 [Planctomycetota bacterium]|nr:MAG: hypothetical protein BroJett003_12170 [Planctomycetota bacterium]
MHAANHNLPPLKRPPGRHLSPRAANAAVVTQKKADHSRLIWLERYDQAWLECEVLKIGHHGSETTSTSEAWAAAISPDAAVVSAGYSNRFAHPRKKVIQGLMPFTVAEDAHPMRWGWREGTAEKFENLPDFTEAIHSTATYGNIVVSSDGSEYAIAFDQRAQTRRGKARQTRRAVCHVKRTYYSGHQILLRSSNSLHRVWRTVEISA